MAETQTYNLGGNETRNNGYTMQRWMNLALTAAGVRVSLLNQNSSSTYFVQAEQDNIPVTEVIPDEYNLASEPTEPQVAVHQTGPYSHPTKYGDRTQRRAYPTRIFGVRMYALGVIDERSICPDTLTGGYRGKINATLKQMTGRI